LPLKEGGTGEHVRPGASPVERGEGEWCGPRPHRQRGAQGGNVVWSLAGGGRRRTSVATEGSGAARGLASVWEAQGSGAARGLAGGRWRRLHRGEGSDARKIGKGIDSLQYGEEGLGIEGWVAAAGEYRLVLWSISNSNS